ncbi:MAG: hypothetical protein WDO69_04365 [Pseudomonadota bacterium]
MSPAFRGVVREEGTGMVAERQIHDIQQTSWSLGQAGGLLPSFLLKSPECPRGSQGETKRADMVLMVMEAGI